MRWAIIDTSVYINHWERGLHDEILGSVRKAFIVRQSAVVLSELRRGARTPQARRLVDALFRVDKVHWSPSAADWWEAGLKVRVLGDAQRWDRNRRRTFQNDVLIALTARRHGATVLTANKSDFELLGEDLGIAILAV